MRLFTLRAPKRLKAQMKMIGNGFARLRQLGGKLKMCLFPLEINLHYLMTVLICDMIKSNRKKMRFAQRCKRQWNGSDTPKNVIKDCARNMDPWPVVHFEGQDVPPSFRTH